MIKIDCNIIVNKLLNDFVNFYQYRNNFFELDNLNLVNEFFNINFNWDELRYFNESFYNFFDNLLNNLNISSVLSNNF